MTAPRARTLRRRLIGGPASWGDTAGVPTPQAPPSTQAASPQARRPPGRRTLPRVGFLIRPPYSRPALTCLPPPLFPGGQGCPHLLHSAHTLPGPGVPGPLEHPISFAASPSSCSRPCPPTPPVPAHSFCLHGGPTAPTLPGLSLCSCLLPSPSRTGALGPQGTRRLAAASPPRAENCPVGHGQQPALTAPCLRLPGRARVSSPSVAARGKGPTAPPVHRPPGFSS